MIRKITLLFFLLLLFASRLVMAAESETVPPASEPPVPEVTLRSSEAFPAERLVLDWMEQDGIETFGSPDEKSAYVQKCQARRTARLAGLTRTATQFFYLKHCVMGGKMNVASAFRVTDEYALTIPEEPYQWARKEHPYFHPGAQLCRLTILPDGTFRNEILLETKEGQIREPALDYDAKTLFFSMRQDFTNDNYHLFRLELDSLKVTQLTFDSVVDGVKMTCCDVEPCALPDGKIVFSSTRCVQLDPCGWNASGNLYVCNPDGSGIRRLGFDQVTTLFPQVMEDGRILFTRWEYSDRSALHVQSLFTMNPDGTTQTAFYGNSSLFPTSLLHARQIPGLG